MNETIDILKNSMLPYLRDNCVFAYAPGRINLIGEHTDYNGGYVFPAAINYGIVAGVQKNKTNKVRVTSFNLNKRFEFTLKNIHQGACNGWENYILGIVAELIKAGYKLDGFDLFLHGNIPLGAGISSSAALENSIVMAINQLFALGLDPYQMISISQKSEHNYAGVMCGIMDQYASMLGRENQAFLLNCNTLECTYTDINFGVYELILIHSNVNHSLGNSAYNTRRSLCEQVAHIFGADTLCEVPISTLQQHKAKLTEDEFTKASYVLNENKRVVNAFMSLQNKDVATFGKLLFESHEGLQFDYQVSCPEIDFLVAFAQKSKEVLGSRMMGAGFGGCTLNLVKKESAQFLKAISESYFKKFNKTLSILPIDLTNGARIL